MGSRGARPPGRSRPAPKHSASMRTPATGPPRPGLRLRAGPFQRPAARGRVTLEGRPRIARAQQAGRTRIAARLAPGHGPATKARSPAVIGPDRPTTATGDGAGANAGPQTTIGDRPPRRFPSARCRWFAQRSSHPIGLRHSRRLVSSSIHRAATVPVRAEKATIAKSISCFLAVPPRGGKKRPAGNRKLSLLIYF